MFLKVLEVPRNFFQEVSWWGAGVKPLPDKSKFKDPWGLKSPRPHRRGDFSSFRLRSSIRYWHLTARQMAGGRLP
jgi:hypothetical protein